MCVRQSLKYSRIVGQIIRTTGLLPLSFILLAAGSLPAETPTPQESAESIFQESLDLNSTIPLALDRKKEIRRQIIDRYPGTAYAYFCEAWFAGRNGDEAESIPLYRKAIELKPDFELAYNNLAYQYLSMGKFDEASAVILEGMDRMPTRHYLYNTAAVITLNAEDYPRAVKYLLSSIEEAPDLADNYPYQNLAMLAYAFSENDPYGAKSLNLLAEIIVRYSLFYEPGDPDSLALLGKCYFGEGELERAKEQYEEARAVDPESQTVRELGRMLDSSETQGVSANQEIGSPETYTAIREAIDAGNLSDALVLLGSGPIRLSFYYSDVFDGVCERLAALKRPSFWGIEVIPEKTR